MREKVQISLAQHSISSKAFLGGLKQRILLGCSTPRRHIHGNNSNGLADAAREGSNSHFSSLGCNVKEEMEEEGEGELTA